MIKTEEDRKDSTSSASTVCKKETSDGRGRKQERESSETAKVEETHSADDNKDTPGKENKMERKRKRSRKGLDKKYLCPHEDCGKSYSRAEHLYRHQLNRESDTAASTRDNANAASRQPEADIQMRLSRLRTVFRKTRSVYAP